MASRKTPLVALVDSASKMGGVEFSTLYLAQRLDKTQFGCIVICREDGDLPSRCRENNIPVAIVPLPRSRSTGVQIGHRRLPNPFALILNAFIFFFAARILARELRKLQVDLVCTKGLPAHFYGGLAARLSGIPCVWHVQDLVSERLGSLYPMILGRTGRILARRVIADGSTIRDQLAPFIPADRLIVIHNGVDIDVFAPTVDGKATRAAWGASESEVLIGNIARLTPWKGQDYLISAFARVAPDYPASKLVLVGSPVFDKDVFEQKLRGMAADLGIAERVVFAGFRWDLPIVLAALDIFVHASIEKDTSPLAVVSAMASGKAIVSTDVKGVAELFVADVEAILVAPADVVALSEGLRRVLSDPALRNAMATAVRRKAESALSLDHFAAQCGAVFNAALGGR